MTAGSSWIAADALRRHLEAGGAVVVDTAAIFNARRLLTWAGDIARMREGGSTVRLVIPALVHAERLYQVRRQHARFDEAMVHAHIEVLRHAGAVFAPFDVRAAEAMAGALCDRYATDEAWDAARGGSRHRRQSTTVDWFIAAHALPDAVVVTADAGPEWTWVRCARPDDLTAVLGELAPPTP